MNLAEAYDSETPSRSIHIAYRDIGTSESNTSLKNSDRSAVMPRGSGSQLSYRKSEASQTRFKWSRSYSKLVLLSMHHALALRNGLMLLW